MSTRVYDGEKWRKEIGKRGKRKTWKKDYQEDDNKYCCFIECFILHREAIHYKATSSILTDKIISLNRERTISIFAYKQNERNRRTAERITTHYKL